MRKHFISFLLALFLLLAAAFPSPVSAAEYRYHHYHSYRHRRHMRTLRRVGIGAGGGAAIGALAGGGKGAGIGALAGAGAGYIYDRVKRHHR